MNYSWAPGFRFYPTEEELVSFYLQNKLLDPNRQDLDTVIPLLDIYEFSPGDLPKYAGEICAGDGEQWFFFIPRQGKEAQGGRPNRLTSSGYWKATGSPGFVYSSQNRVIGLKKTMVFYKGRAPKGTKTEWKLNEYRAAAAATIATAIEGLQPHSSSSTSNSSATPQFRQELSLCRLYKRSKCLRSFDRRPLLTTGEGSGSVDHPQAPARSDHHHEAATTAAATTSHHENQNSSSPILMVDRNMIMPSSSSSADDVSSSLGDHSNSNNTNPSDHLDSDLPIWEWEWEWDWEPFNWINDQGEDHL